MLTGIAREDAARINDEGIGIDGEGLRIVMGIRLRTLMKMWTHARTMLQVKDSQDDKRQPDHEEVHPRTQNHKFKHAHRHSPKHKNNHMLGDMVRSTRHGGTPA